MEPISQTAPILPGRPVLQQFWADVTFLHWRVDASVVAPLLPPGIVPDVFGGSSELHRHYCFCYHISGTWAYYMDS